MSTAVAERPSTAGPPRRTQGFEVIAWIEQNCVYPQGRWVGQPFILLLWQKLLILALFEINPATRMRLFRWAYISVPKKNGKTALMAALALWFLIGSGEPSPVVVCAAGSDDQADLLFDAAKTMAELSPTLQLLTKVYEAEIHVPSIVGARLVRVSASARKFGSNLDGKDIYVVICDELHVWEGERGRLVWGTLTRGGAAREQPMVIQITTAGFDRESICWEQYVHAKKVLADPSFDPAYYAYIVEADETDPYDSPATWAKVNPSYGVIMQEAYYTDQLTKQPINEFKRFYCNMWTLSLESWLPEGAWDRCLDPELDIPLGEWVVCATDVSLRRDATAVAWVWPILAEEPTIVVNADGEQIEQYEVLHWVVRAKVWEPPKGGKIDYGAVKKHIRWLRNNFELAEAAYDPRLFELPAAELLDDDVPMVEFPQSIERMIPACAYAYEQIAGTIVAHDGDAEFTDHVLSATQRQTEAGWTLSKGRSKRHIDACIAMVMALRRAAQLLAIHEEESFFGGMYA
jgi:phage terminase large subunit-like protein